MLPSPQMAETLITKTIEFQVAKTDTPQRRLFGWGYQSVTADGTQVVDHSDDVIDNEVFTDFENAHYRYMRESREGDDHHQTFGVMKVIESVVMSPEKARHMGLDEQVPSGVWLGFEFEKDDVGEAAWQKAHKADRLMLSMVGWGERTAL